jgi:hypothetical protein
MMPAEAQRKRDSSRKEYACCKSVADRRLGLTCFQPFLESRGHSNLDHLLPLN